MGIPTLVVAHGEGATASLERIRWLAEEAAWLIYAEQHETFSLDDAEPIIEHVGQGTPLLLLHIVRVADLDPEIGGSTDTPPIAPILEAVTAHSRDVLRRYPGVDLRQWAIVLTGRTLDPSERTLLCSLTASTRGVVVTAASTNTSVAHPLEVEAAFGADVALVLGTSGLEAELGEQGGAWLCGIGSVSYSTDRLRHAVAAMRATQLFTQLLSDEDDGSVDLGEDWVEDLQLDTEAAWLGLLDSPAGGSLLSRVRFGDLDFKLIPVESWADAIVARHDMAAVGDIPIITDRVRAAADARFLALRDTFGKRVLTELEDTRSIPATVSFCEGMALALNRAADRVDDKSTPSIPGPIIEEDRRKLRDLLRWLPYGSAVALRLLAVALLIVILGSAAAGSAEAPVDILASPWPLAVAAAVLLVGAGLYGRRRRRTVRVRDRLASTLEQQLVDQVCEIARSAHVDALHRLLTWIGATPPWWPGEAVDEVPESADSAIAWLAWNRVRLDLASAEFARRSEHRTIRSVGSTEFAVDIPTAQTMPTKQLAPGLDEDAIGSAVRRFVAFLRPLLLHDPPNVPTVGDLAGATTDMLAGDYNPPWDDLAEILTKDASAASEATSVLKTDLTPTGGQTSEVAHYLIVAGGQAGRAAAALLPSRDETAHASLQRLSAVKATTAPSFAAMVHMYELEVAPQEEL